VVHVAIPPNKIFIDDNDLFHSVSLCLTTSKSLFYSLTHTCMWTKFTCMAISKRYSRPTTVGAEIYYFNCLIVVV
jgi:hypothetical protein